MKRYALPELFDSKAHEALVEHPELLRKLLIGRGITTASEAAQFLNPSYELHVHDPFLMTDMERAVDRILTAIERKEKIVIYSDYDCDGGPGGVLLYSLFKKLNYEHFSNYIPHRHAEGYGLNIPAIDSFIADGAKLLITVDCGITDLAPVRHAQEHNVDVIVTDHHIPGDELPRAFAVLNPKRKDDVYPDPMLCGTGVAFKLAQALLRKGNFNVHPEWEKWLLDMVGIATVADMVPLRGENRALAYFGLKVLRKSRRPGIEKLCKIMRTNQRYLTEDDIGFMIAPRINAASRMDEPMQAFKLLATEDEGEAGALARHLNKINDARKGLVASMAKEIKKRLSGLGEVREVIVMGDPRWRPSLLGLAANTLMEEYHRPVFLWGREGGDVLKGSCRSDGSVDLVKLMSQAKELFIDAGGHMLAGGFSLVQDKIHLLESKLIEAYRSLKQEVLAETVYRVDDVLTLEHVTLDNYRLLERLAPFGEGNPKPLFAFPNIRIESVKTFGRDKGHLELRFKNGSNNEIVAIGFFMTPEQFSKRIEPGNSIDLIANLERSFFGASPSLRLRIVDIV